VTAALEIATYKSKYSTLRALQDTDNKSTDFILVIFAVLLSAVQILFWIIFLGFLSC